MGGAIPGKAGPAGWEATVKAPGKGGSWARGAGQSEDPKRSVSKDIRASKLRGQLSLAGVGDDAAAFQPLQDLHRAGKISQDPEL